MSTTKKIPLSAALSISTGILVGSFDDLHEAMEHVLGRPVWTHELGQRPVWDAARSILIGQHPALGGIHAGDLETSCAGKSRDERRVLVSGWLEEQVAHIGASELDVVGSSQKSDDEVSDALEQSILQLQEDWG